MPDRDTERALRVRPVTLDVARRFVREVHRHNKPPESWRWGCGLFQGEQLVGVGMAGDPVGPFTDDVFRIEFTRVCTDGTRNACSKLYGHLSRAAKELGWEEAITYTLASEPGTSLKASGWVKDAEIPARGYGGGRARYEENLFGERSRPEEPKVRWRKRLQSSVHIHVVPAEPERIIVPVLIEGRRHA